MTRSDTGPTLAASAAAAQNSLLGVVDDPIGPRSDVFVPALSALPPAGVKSLGEEVWYACGPSLSPCFSSYDSPPVTRRPSVETLAPPREGADPAPHAQGSGPEEGGSEGGEAVGHWASVSMASPARFGTATDFSTCVGGSSRRGRLARAAPPLSSSLALRPFWLRFENTDVEAWCVLRPFLARPLLSFAVTCFSVPCAPSSDQENLPWH